MTSLGLSNCSSLQYKPETETLLTVLRGTQAYEVSKKFILVQFLFKAAFTTYTYVHAEIRVPRNCMYFALSLFLHLQWKRCHAYFRS